MIDVLKAYVEWWWDLSWAVSFGAWPLWILYGVEVFLTGVFLALMVVVMPIYAVVFGIAHGIESARHEEVDDA